MAFSCQGIPGMQKPMTQGGQVLVLDEILGSIYIFFPCIYWIIAFSILQDYHVLSWTAFHMFFVKMPLELGHYLLLLRAVVVAVGSNINPLCHRRCAWLSLSLYSVLCPTALADCYWQIPVPLPRVPTWLHRRQLWSKSLGGVCLGMRMSPRGSTSFWR